MQIKFINQHFKLTNTNEIYNPRNICTVWYLVLANSPVLLFVVQKHVAIDFNEGNEHRIYAFGP